MFYRRSDRVDEYVRRATRLDPDQLAGLDDPVRRQALFEQITRTPTAEPRPEPGRRRVLLAAAATAAAVMAIVAIGGVVALSGVVRNPPPVASAPGPPAPAPPSTGGHGDLFPNEATSCAVHYPADLADTELAFDGTVTAIGTEPVNDPAWPAGGGPDVDVPVTFAVNRWYRGGGGATITVAMRPPGTVDSTQLDTQASWSYQVGSRLLLSSGWLRSGTGRPWRYPRAWSCGFTRWHTADDAALWDEVFR